MRRLIFISILLLLPGLSWAQGVPLGSAVLTEGGQVTRYSLNMEIVVLMTAITLLPSMLLMMTPFIRIIVVMSLLRQALGTGQTPPNQVLVGLALFLTLFIMSPIIGKIYETSFVPYLNSKITVDEAVAVAEKPVRDFMVKQTRQEEISNFMHIAKNPPTQDVKDVPFATLVPAFITSELKSAFTIGFLIYIPFVVIDLIVASVLMSMGMMMLSPMIISMPFKLMLFVLVDGWSLTIGSLAASFVNS